MKKNNYEYPNGTLRNKLNIKDNEKLKQAESDIVTVRINEVIKEGYFEPTEDYIRELHKYLFSDVYEFAGCYRTIDIYKSERVLAGLSVEYASPDNIEYQIRCLIEFIKNTDFDSLNKEERVDYITEVIVSLWNTHPFREGNTRTTLVYMRELLKSYGIEFDKNFFKNNGTFEYARDALVAACFESKDFEVERNYVYIKRMISDIMDTREKRK